MEWFTIMRAGWYRCNHSTLEKLEQDYTMPVWASALPLKKKKNEALRQPYQLRAWLDELRVKLTKRLEAALVCQTSMLSADKCLVKAVLGHEPGKMISGGTWKGMKLKPGFGSCSWALWIWYISHGLLFLMSSTVHTPAPGHAQQSSSTFWLSQTNTEGQREHIDLWEEQS